MFVTKLMSIGLKHNNLVNDTNGDSVFMVSSLIKQWHSLSEGESDFIVNCSQFSAFLMQQVELISWSGFYWHRQEKLVVGAYQGPIACTKIDLNSGVCGAAYSSAKTQIVADVSQFEGHIACDSKAVSEIVIPILKDDTVIGVFDIDSYTLDRFDLQFANVMEQLLEIFVANTRIPEFE